MHGISRNGGDDGGERRKISPMIADQRNSNPLDKHLAARSRLGFVQQRPGNPSTEPVPMLDVFREVGRRSLVVIPALIQKFYCSDRSDGIKFNKRQAAGDVLFGSC